MRSACGMVMMQGVDMIEGGSSQSSALKVESEELGGGVLVFCVLIGVSFIRRDRCLKCE